MIDKPTIKEGMTLKLEKILDLQKKDSLDEAWRDLPGIIDQMVKFEKQMIKMFQGYASSAGVKFAQAAWKETWEPGKEVTPVALIMRALRGKEFSEVCTKPDLRTHKSKYFNDECDQAISGHNDVKVVDVLKSAYATDSGWLSSGTNWRVSSKSSTGGRWSDQPRLNEYSDLKNNGYQKGLVAEQCPQLWSWWSLIQSTADKKVCEELLKAVFGNNVPQKRYCCLTYRA
ncbi:hypothetical protein MHLP_03555 [Candidatus Mycoplasma haematolamae str. Purdue]|uniref:Uncharacterized protein n=1 Tax=Mycoplasma haematolamae (strain Purdue) TaxID=1212765 RepID=I7CGA6_MYCHA|nr:hypothetical protein [Candidatus Mycoplasma haematolamae]AFO52291.1 hypothetical protein MHLP_03555 [Candidatus Mycoplasma haematolamae str. Purdue]